MDKPVAIRRVRIAISLFFAVLALSTLALWIRSYSWFDTFSFSIDGQRSQWMGSIAGEMRYGRPMTMRAHGLKWQTYDEPVSEWLKSESPRQSVLGFRWGRSSRGPHACPIIPHWFHVLVFAALAVAACVAHRFSLRTLLIATTLVAVVLGLVCYTVR